MGGTVTGGGEVVVVLPGGWVEDGAPPVPPVLPDCAGPSNSHVPEAQKFGVCVCTTYVVGLDTSS